MMKTLLLSVSLLCAGAVFAKGKDKDKAKQPTPAATADTAKKAPAATAKSIKDKVKSSKKIDGLFTMYQDTATGSLQMYVKKDQLGKNYIYQSFSMGGPVSLFLNQNMIRNTWLFQIEKAFDKLEFLQLNTSFYYDKNNAVSKSENVDVAESVFFSDKLVAEDSTGYLIAVDGLFLSEKLDPIRPVMRPGVPPGAIFNLGALNPTKSKYGSIKSFDQNTDVLVDLAYDNPAPLNGGGKDITDARYVRVKMQHSFIEMPKNDFRPRRDDPRVGFFGVEVDDLTSKSVTPYKDIISRWNLVKKDPSAAISEPVEPIVYWIENTTPVELRPYVKEAGEKWNEAFEKAGFKNAIVMKQMPDDATWDPADLKYNVIRWVSSSTPPYGAIGPSFVNPLTGQILGADITVEWKSGAGANLTEDLFESAYSSSALPWNNPEAAMHPDQLQVAFGKNHLQACTLAQGLSMQFQNAMTAIETLDGELPEDKKAAAVSDMHRQYVYYLVLHEMGHTLGLMHNMKATQMLSPAQLNDVALTHKVGLMGSVMDYPLVNISSDRSKQGDYYTTKCGPYDLWAIEYGYTPFSASEEEAGLKKILAHSTEFGHEFGNDADDMRSSSSGIDPRVNIYDQSNDMLSYGEDRYKLVNSMMPKLKARFAKDGETYQLLRARYGQLNSQRAQVSAALSRYVGGVMVNRSFIGQEPNAKPFTPVPVAQQKKAMDLLGKYVFAPNAFEADGYLLPYLQIQRRGFNFFGATEDIKPQSYTNNIQMTALTHLLHPNTLTRINNSTLYGNTYTCADVMSDLVKNIFASDIKGNVNLYRQNLQTEFVKALAAITDAPMAYDNASKAAALSSLKKVKTMLATAVSADEQTKAHRTNLNFLIEKALAVD